METTSGHFFFRVGPRGKKGSSERYCYNKIVCDKTKQNEENCPIFVTLDANILSFQISSYHAQILGKTTFPGYYGTGTIHEVDFATDSITEITAWIADGSIISSLVIDPHIYCRNEKKPERRSYSGLGCWKKNTEETSNQTLLTKRELTLDFLFDLFHSDVFSHNEGAKKLKTAIKKVPLANGVCAKALFNYFVEISLRDREQKKKSGINENSGAKVEPKEKTWHNTMLNESALYYVKFLRSQEAENILNLLKETETAEQWFDHIESEHKTVLKWCKKSDLQKEANVSAQWFLQRYAILDALKLHFWTALLPVSRGVVCCIALWIIWETSLPFFYNDNNSVYWHLTILMWFGLGGFAMALGFVTERILTLIFAYFFQSQHQVKRRLKNIGWLNQYDLKPGHIISALLNGIKIYLPKVLIIIILAWWWILHSYCDNNSGLADMITIFKSFFLYFILFYLIVLIGIIMKTIYMSSSHYPNKLLGRSLTLTLVALTSSLVIGIYGFTFTDFIHCGSATSDVICWSFGGNEFMIEKVSVTQLYIYAVIAAALGLIFELSANSIIEILSP